MLSVLLLKERSLQKHAYSNIWKILQPKKGNFSDKNSDIFHISAQNIDCGYSLEPPRRGGSNEYPKSMFLSRNKKNNVYSCKPQFYYIKVGLKGVKIYRRVFVMFFMIYNFVIHPSTIPFRNLYLFGFCHHYLRTRYFFFFLFFFSRAIYSNLSIAWWKA